jgi:hypothetical protein
MPIMIHITKSNVSEIYSLIHHNNNGNTFENHVYKHRLPWMSKKVHVIGDSTKHQFKLLYIDYLNKKHNILIP